MTEDEAQAIYREYVEAKAAWSAALQRAFGGRDAKRWCGRATLPTECRPAFDRLHRATEAYYEMRLEKCQ